MSTGDSRAFAGYHQRFDETGNVCGQFIIYRINDGWYWQSRYVGELKPTPFGPYPTAEGAYLAATGD